MASSDTNFVQEVGFQINRASPLVTVEGYLKKPTVCQNCGNERRWLIRCEYCGDTRPISLEDES